MNATMAAVLAVAGFVLLVPTFNALNSASFEPRDPPFDFEPPTPDELPDEIPPGEDDLPVTPPTPPTPDENPCPDPTPVPESEHQDTFQGPSLLGGADDSVPFVVGGDHVGIVLTVTFQQYVGDLTLGLAAPDGESFAWQPASTGPGAESGTWSETVQGPVPGDWTFTWSANPVAGGGGLDLSLVRIDCGEADAP